MWMIDGGDDVDDRGDDGGDDVDDGGDDGGDDEDRDR